MRRYSGLLLFLPLFLLANPQGEKVVSGSCEVYRSATVMDIQQNSDRAIVEWGDFSISHGEFTQFHQPSATSAILNRVVGNQLSEIHGHIKSNGLVYLINQNGILVGPNGRIKTGGFLASTLNVANGEFLDAGEMKFSGESNAGLSLKGELWSPKGNIFLISKRVEHTGKILAPEGEVYGLAGTEIIVKPEGEMKLIRISGEGTLENTGMIETVQAELRAAGGEIDTLAINHSGIIHANGFEEREGRITLSGEKEIVRVSGELIARNDQEGGTIHILGEKVGVDEDALIDASGSSHGGTVLIGGDFRERTLKSLSIFRW